MNKREIIEYIRKLAQKEISSLLGGVKTPLFYGTWLLSESEDPNLSQVQLEDITVRGVRKLKHVTGLTAGDAVLMVKGGPVGLTIIGVIQGNINAIEVG